MTLPVIIFTSLLAGLSAASLLWFGTDFLYRMNYTMAQRRRAKKLAAKEAPKPEEGKGK